VNSRREWELVCWTWHPNGNLHKEGCSRQPLCDGQRHRELNMTFMNKHGGREHKTSMSLEAGKQKPGKYSPAGI
jgi:hypothetical protein